MEHVTYKIRWLLLAGIFICGFNRQFTGTAFAIANDAVAQFFRVSNYEVDLLSIGDAFLAILVCLLLGVFGRLVRLRAQCLIVVTCMAAANLLTAIAFTSRDFYVCVIIGRLLSGLATGIFYILPATFANKWFPPHEVATAFSVPFIGFSTGGVTSSLLLPYLVPNNDNDTAIQSEDTQAMAEVGHVFAFIFGVGASLLTAVTIFFCLYARDSPPTPPGKAEAFIARSNQNRTFKFRAGLRGAVALLFNRPFLLLTVANFLSTSALVLFVVLMPSLVFATFPGISSSTVGVMNSVGFASSMISTFLAGRLLDKFGRYKAFSCVGTGLMVFFCAGIYLSHFRQHFISLCILYPLLFMTRSFTVTTFIEFLVEVSYPKDKTVVTSMHFAFYNLAFFVSASLERLAFSKCGPSCAILYPTFANLVALGLLVFVKPDYKRSRANEDKRDHVDMSREAMTKGNIEEEGENTTTAT